MFTDIFDLKFWGAATAAQVVKFRNGRGSVIDIDDWHFASQTCCGVDADVWGTGGRRHTWSWTSRGACAGACQCRLPGTGQNRGEPLIFEILNKSEARGRHLIRFNIAFGTTTASRKLHKTRYLTSIRRNCLSIMWPTLTRLQTRTYSLMKCVSHKFRYLQESSQIDNEIS